MSQTPSKPRRFVHGDLVSVRSSEEILSTLDERGALNGIPFMPEMVDFVGKQFRVRRRVEHFSCDAERSEDSTVRAFPEEDVVVLENVRCTGAQHGGCKRNCTIFWKEAWLRPASPESKNLQPGNHDALANRLMSIQPSNSELYYCQSSQLLGTTYLVQGKERLKRCFRNVVSGNYPLFEMIRNLGVWFYVRGREKLLGKYPLGKLQKTPVEVLDLQPGELVEVKSLDEVKKTLDANGLNRGLHFSPEMIPFCGRQHRVLARADKMIEEGTGRMRTMRNTIILENSICDSATWAFGACPREDHIYWREIWLKRVQPKD
jgi:hypothetical protein